MMDNEDFIELPVDSWTIVRSSKLTELEREADQAKAALAAQSGYAEHEAQADLQAVKKEAWEAGAQWMLQRFLDLPSVVRANFDQTDIKLVSYMGEFLEKHAEQYALPNNDPRKGAE